MDDVHGLQLRTPTWLRASEADRLVLSNAEWALQAVARREQAKSNKVALTNGTALPLLGERVELVLRPAHRTRTTLRGNQLVVAGPEHDQTQLREILEKWYRFEARGRLCERLIELGAPLDLRPTGVTIRAQRTRWGSCNRHGGINLNWRLLLLPLTLSDYVLAHELCHLRHMNHSRAFWELLGQLMPDYKAREVKLNDVRGAELVL